MNLRNYLRAPALNALILAGAAALVGCAPPSPGTFGEDFEASLCEWATGCRAFEEVEQCRDALVWESYGRFDDLVDAIAAGRIRFDEETARRCLAAIEGLSCDESTLSALLFSSGFQAAPAVCEDVYVGKIGNYEPCVHSEECVGDAVCGFAPCDEACCPGSCRRRDLDEGPAIGEPCGGICAAGAYCLFDPEFGLFTTCAERKGVGADCSSDSSICLEELFCAYQDGNNRCREPLQAGESCGGGERCAEGLSCYYWDNAEPRCQLLPDLGSVCYGGNYPACARVDSYCDDVTNTCAQFGSPGEPCTSGCVPYAECDYSGDASVCVARAGLGELCEGAGNGPYVSCLGHLRCIEGRCKPPEPAPSCKSPQ